MRPPAATSTAIDFLLKMFFINLLLLKMFFHRSASAQDVLSSICFCSRCSSSICFIDLLHRFSMRPPAATSTAIDFLLKMFFIDLLMLHRFASAQDVLHRSASDQDVLHRYASSICFIDFLSSARFCLRSVSSISFIDVLHRSSSMMLLLMISPLLLSRSIVAVCVC
ncbi:hypothetical protein L6452_08434 [Arctium lappa]|uniref:Uncharacterized protein n=1 Tax=Arctium lappa TaxID=4217 RepID=A0ACB9DH86_ARCLA|nr:hypothetical protein L6452_08434 [Arctium lappa]